jgi:hypothetical protein
MLAQSASSWLWTVVAFIQASTGLSRVVASGPFCFISTSASEKSAPFQVGYFPSSDGPIRSLLPKPTFAFSRILYPLANWPFLTVGLEKLVDKTRFSITMGLTEFRVVEVRWGLGTCLYAGGSLVL